MKIAALLVLAGLAATVTGCAAIPAAGPAEVTRFVAPEATDRLGRGTVFVDTAPGQDSDALALAPYKAAVARELVRLGYREAPRDAADQIAQVRLEQVARVDDAPRRSPVSVGIGGSTGSFGSGIGLGVGINLGQSRQQDAIDTRLGVMIRDKATGTTYWEGRAQLSVSARSPLAASEANAAALAWALLRDFPGVNGATVDVKVTE